MNKDLQKAIERSKGIPAPYTFAADTTVRAIDLVCRVFCTPAVDRVLIVEPTHDAYPFVARANRVEYKTIGMNHQLTITADEVLSACDEDTRMVWLCSPNPLTGISMQRDEMHRLLSEFSGWVLVDDRLSDYERQRPLRMELPRQPRLIVVSEPGLVFASPDVINRLHALDDLYLTSKSSYDELADPYELERSTTLTLQERDRMMEAFRLLPMCQQVYPSDAPFFVVRMERASELAAYLRERGISVDVVPQRPDCLLIPVRSRTDNNALIGALRRMAL